MSSTPRRIVADRAIESARTLARLRALSSRERNECLRNPDFLAKHFVGTRYRVLASLFPVGIARRIVELVSPGSYGFAIARTKYFDEALISALNQGIRQVVILGAGYDSRAYRFRELLKDTTVFELDFAGTQAVKKAVLTKLYGKTPEHVVYFAIDFRTQRLGDMLQRAGFDYRLKSFFLWEGVSYYLSEQAVDDVLRFLADHCVPDTRIAFDYATRVFVEGDHGSYGGKQIARWLKKIGEPFLCGIDPHNISRFLEDRGLAVIRDLGPRDLERTFLQCVDGTKLGRVLGHVHMVVARVTISRGPGNTPVAAT